MTEKNLMIEFNNIINTIVGLLQKFVVAEFSDETERGLIESICMAA